MSLSNSDSSSADVKPSEMNDNGQIIRQLCPTFQSMAVDNERPSTSEEGHSTMMMVEDQGNKFDRVMKRELDTRKECDEIAKRSRLEPADPLQGGRNSDVMIDTDSTESGLGDRLLEEDTERVIQPALFDDNETYKTTSAVRKTLHGTAYQWKHMMLVVHRAREKGYSFRFATEMDAAEKFDDAVLEYQDPVKGRVHRFLQFKHESVYRVLETRDLLTTAKKNPFGMVKYFNSWREVRNNPIFNASRAKEFILCTNIGLDVVGLKAKSIEVMELPMNDLLKVTVGPKRSPCFYKLVDERSILRHMLEKEAGASKVEVSEFLEEFVLAVNQPNESELGTMIKHELGASHQFNLLNVDYIGSRFQDMMVNLLKKTEQHSKFLSGEEVDAFFKKLQRELSSLIAVGLKLSYSAELENYDIEFEGENSDIREFLDSFNPARNSILKLTSSNPTLLTALRVYQTVKQIDTYKKKDSSIFIHLEKLLLPDITDQVLCAFGSSISHDLIVIDCGSSSNHEHSQTLWSRLRDILDEIRRKKLILIIQEHDSSVVREICHKRDDEISIIDLAECSRRKLLKRNIIKFQGHEKWTSFGEIFSIHDFDDLESDELLALKKIMKTETLIQLIRGEEIVMGSEIQGLGDVEKYYIPRTIVERVVIKAEILKDPNVRDLFAIGGIDQEALEKIVKTENRNQSLEKSSLKKECYILPSGLEADHFRNICEQNSERNIHWLQGETGALVWQQSFGSITKLLAFRDTSMDHDNLEILGAIGFKEDKLAKHDKKRRIVILSDTAGMGKSTLLTCLAGKMKRDQSSLLVIKVDLTQYTGVLKAEKDERTFETDDTNGVVNFLVDKLSNLNTDFERNLFKEIIKVTGETVVLIDGYDEICPDYGDVVIDFLRSLAKLRIKRLFVTTRPHTSNVLERKFGTFSYVLQPFDRKNQIEFLTKFWGRELNLNDSDGTIKVKLEEHASAVLEILSKLINSQMQEFTGIPLQLRLVAEAFPFGDKGKLKRLESSEEPIYITDLYRCFVDKKFEIFFEQKSSADSTNLGQKKYRKLMYRSFLTKHQKLALAALFDDKTVTTLMKCQQKTDGMLSSSQDEQDEDEGEERSGIVTRVINGKPHFIHRTFAEYFAAAFLSKKLKHNDCDPQVQKFFVKEFLIEQEYKTIRAFLNCLLCRRDHAPHKESWAFDLSKNCRARGRTLYHVAVEECNTGIARFFSIRLGISPAAKSPKQDPNINLVDKDLKTPLMLAVSKHVLALVECLVEGGADVNREARLWRSTALHLALKSKAEINLVKYLVENGAEINRQSEDGSTALHRALQGGAKLDVIKCLVENGAEINRQSKEGLTALHCALRDRAKLDIIKYLVENGAEINRQSVYGSAALNYAFQGGAKLDVIKYLVENGAEINHEMKDCLTPLHNALASKAELDVIKYLVENGAEINRQSKCSITELSLHLALFNRAKLEVIKYLVENGAEINRESTDGRTSLYFALVRGARLDVVKYLVENGAEINRESKDGSTALHWVVCPESRFFTRDGYSSELESITELNIAKYLVENGAEINRESKNGLTPLHSALRNGARLDIVQYLVETGAEINRKLEDGSTVLHCAIQGGTELEVIKYLVETGAEINRESKDGSTELHCALQRYFKLDLIEYLFENGAEINRESNDGLTALHYALLRRHNLDVVKYLVENGADINRESKNGSTTLHYALLGNAELDVVKYLVENGVDINRESKDGSTALRCAFKRNATIDIIRYLLENDGEINFESKDGSTAQKCALQGGVIMYLAENGVKINPEFSKRLCMGGYSSSSPGVAKYLSTEMMMWNLNRKGKFPIKVNASTITDDED